MSDSDQEGVSAPPRPVHTAPPLCVSCGTGVAKYCCPRCSVRTCSLACVTAHKGATGCSGRREAFDAVQSPDQMTEASFTRDFRFLRECEEGLDSGKRRVAVDEVATYTFRDLPPPLAAVRSAAKRRGVVCQFISEGLSRRRINTTRYVVPTDTLTWRVEFQFGGGDPFSASTNWGNERFKLCDLLRHSAESDPKLPLFPIRLEGPQAGAAAAGPAPPPAPTAVPSLNAEQLLLQERILRFVERHPRYVFLHRLERIPGLERRYIQVEQGTTVHDALRTLFFVNEFPTFLVVPPEELPRYTIATAADKAVFRESFRKRPRSSDAAGTEAGQRNKVAVAETNETTNTGPHRSNAKRRRGRKRS